MGEAKRRDAARAADEHRADPTILPIADRAPRVRATIPLPVPRAKASVSDAKPAATEALESPIHRRHADQLREQMANVIAAEQAAAMMVKKAVDELGVCVRAVLNGIDTTDPKTQYAFIDVGGTADRPTIRYAKVSPK